MTADDRAFGWPAGTVRAITTMFTTAAFFVGVIAAFFHGGTQSAQELAVVLAPLAGFSQGLYFMNRAGK